MYPRRPLSVSLGVSTGLQALQRVRTQASHVAEIHRKELSQTKAEVSEGSTVTPRCGVLVVVVIVVAVVVVHHAPLHGPDVIVMSIQPVLFVDLCRTLFGGRSIPYQ